MDKNKIKFNTVIDKKLNDKIKRHAIMIGCNYSDIYEKSIINYFKFNDLYSLLPKDEHQISKDEFEIALEYIIKKNINNIKEEIKLIVLENRRG